jgi:hypothetical protein
LFTKTTKATIAASIKVKTMKIKLFFCLLTTISALLKAQKTSKDFFESQFTNEYKLAIYANALNYTINGMHVGGEYFYNSKKENRSLAMNFSTGRYDDRIDSLHIDKHQSFFVEHRFYEHYKLFSLLKLLDIKDVQELFYWGPYLKYFNKQVFQPQVRAALFGLFPGKKYKDFKASAICLGLTLGKRITFNHFFFESNAHIGFRKYVHIDYNRGNNNLKSLKPDFRIAVQIGYQFLIQ